MRHNERTPRRWNRCDTISPDSPPRHASDPIASWSLRLEILPATPRVLSITDYLVFTRVYEATRQYGC